METGRHGRNRPGSDHPQIEEVGKLLQANAIKTYMSSPLFLVSPSEGELLSLYLAVSKFSTSAALVREWDRVQQPVYYCSRALRGVEERYPKMEKLILALVTTSRKLRPYFQVHIVEVPTEYPMKQILYKPKPLEG